MISILMPIYNGIEFINDAVESILLQTYKDWELIIGINGHPPGSDVYKMANVYAGEKIRVIEYPTKGKSNTLNAMIPDATYDHIALLDVDDAWLPTKLEKQMPYIEKYDVIGTHCRYFGELSVVPKIQLGEIDNEQFKTTNMIINSSCLLHKSLCHWNGYWDSVEDYELWLKLASQNKQFYNVPEILVKHRIHRESAFNSCIKQNALLKQLRKKYS